MKKKSKFPKNFLSYCREYGLIYNKVKDKTFDIVDLGFIDIVEGNDYVVTMNYLLGNDDIYYVRFWDNYHNEMTLKEFKETHKIMTLF